MNKKERELIEEQELEKMVNHFLVMIILLAMGTMFMGAFIYSLGGWLMVFIGGISFVLFLIVYELLNKTQEVKQ